MTRRSLLFGAGWLSRAGISALGILTLTGALLGGCSESGKEVASIDSAGSSGSATTAAAPQMLPGSESIVALAIPGSDYATAWGPGVGSSIPMLAANDQTGAAQDLASLAGEKGLLLVFSRSADW